MKTSLLVTDIWNMSFRFHVLSARTKKYSSMKNIKAKKEAINNALLEGKII